MTYLAVIPPWRSNNRNRRPHTQKSTLAPNSIPPPNDTHTQTKSQSPNRNSVRKGKTLKPKLLTTCTSAPADPPSSGHHTKEHHPAKRPESFMAMRLEPSCNHRHHKRPPLRAYFQATANDNQANSHSQSKTAKTPKQGVRQIQGRIQGSRSHSPISAYHVVGLRTGTPTGPKKNQKP